MRLKKTVVLTVFFCLFYGLAYGQEINPDDVKTVELRYRCRLETNNFFYRFLFFLFAGDNKEFTWREKSGWDGDFFFREISVFNREDKQVVGFRNQGDSYEAEVDFGNEELSDKLSAEKTKVWFEIMDFVRSAKTGDVWSGDYPASETSYKIILNENGTTSCEISGERINIFCFKGMVRKRSKKFLEINYWMAAEGRLKGQMVKCSFKYASWPVVTVEIND